VQYALALGGEVFLLIASSGVTIHQEKNMWPPKFSDAIDACNVARRRCERVVTAGLAQSDVNLVASVIVTARDAARIATLTTQLLERGSKYAYPICAVCAQSCEELAKACDKHSKVEAFSRCAEACRKCAQECSKLAKAKKPAR
jgi:hypothetical protein